MEMLLKNAIVITMDAQRNIYENGAVFVKDGRIEAVGESSGMEQAYASANALDCKHNVLIPGLVEPLYDCCGMARCGKGGVDQDGRRETKQEDNLSDEKLEESIFDAEVCAYTALKQGITTLGIVQSAKKAHAFNQKNAWERLAHFPISLLKIETLEYLHVEQAQDNALLLDTVLDRVMPEQAIAFLCAERRRKIISLTPERVYRLGTGFLNAMDETTVITGAYGIAFSDVKLLARQKVSFVYSPDAAQKSAHVVEMMHENIPVALSAQASHSRHPMDLLQTARRAQLLEITARDDYHVLPYAKMLECLTVESAKVMGLEEKGAIASGKAADIVLIDWHAAHLTPNFMPLQMCMGRASAQDFSMVMAGGILVKQNGVMLLAPPKQSITARGEKSNE